MEDILKNITCIIKTFKRPEKLNNLVNSILEFYPDIKIIILNDDIEKMNSKEKNIKIINTEFDIGVSKGRNILVDNVETKYFITLDDDFLFTKETKLENFYKIMESSDLSILSGKVRNKALMNKISIQNSDKGDIVKFLKGYYSLECCKPDKKLEYFITDYVYQFFIARTEEFKSKCIKWDEKIKIGEHSYFFYNIRKNFPDVKVGHTNLVNVEHLHNNNNSNDYYKYRMRAKNARVKNMDRYGIIEFTDYRGVTYNSIETPFFSYIICHKNSSEERNRNIKFLIEYMKQVYNCEIIIVEQIEGENPETYFSLSSKIKHIIIKETGDFNRGKCFNVGEKAAKSNILFFADNDAIVDIETIKKSVLLLSQNFEVVSPYNKVIDLTEKETIDLFPDFIDFETISKKNENIRTGTNIAGGIIGIKRDTFLKIGKWEEFYGWGVEDSLLALKIEKIISKEKVKELPEIVLHLNHERVFKEARQTEQFKNNLKVYYEYKSLSSEELLNKINGIVNISGTGKHKDRFSKIDENRRLIFPKVANDWTKNHVYGVEIKRQEVLKNNTILEIYKNKINHKNIMKIYDYDIKNVYIEYLKDYILLGNKSKYTPQQWKNKKCYLDLVDEINLYYIKDAIEYLHKNGIAHTDITEFNIMVNPKTHEIKIIDLLSSMPLTKELEELDWTCFYDMIKRLENY